MTAVLASLLLLTSSLNRDTSIRTTDWKQFFMSDTANYEIHPDVSDERWGTLFVSLKQFEEGSLAYGFPLISDATYGDLDGDGVEEAEISFDVGGSARVCSYAVFEKSSSGVRTIHQGNGYKMGSRIENDTLNIYQPYPTGYDPNCCAQSIIKTSFLIKDKIMTRVDSTAFGVVHFADAAVRKFYEWIGKHDYEIAYTLLSPGYQENHPYEQWLRGYSTTDSTIADVSYSTEDDTTVAVTITSIDRLNGKTVISNYTGTWKLIWSGLDWAWLLDEPKIRKVR